MTWMKNLRCRSLARALFEIQLSQGKAACALKILGFQLIFYLVVFFNIPVARQVIGFIYLTFVPGIIISKLLRLGSSSWPRRILFSAGFSVAFLLFAGLLINIVSRAFGFFQPLSVIPLVVTLSLVISLLAFFSCFGKDVGSSPISIGPKSVLSLVFLLCLPAMAIVGALLMNFTGNNSILLLVLAAISVLFSVGAFSKKLTYPKIYVFIVLVIALALLFHSAFVSNYVMGNDVQLEYYVFNVTIRNRFWNSTLPQFWDETYGRFNSMLSVTILPAIYYAVLDMDPTWVLKIIYPLIFSLVPVGLFLIYKPYIGMKRAFFSVFLFMAQLTFYTEMIGLSRQMIGELFLVLLFMVLLSRKMDQFKSNLCFIVFGAALVVSHYAVSYIFIIFIAFAWVSSYIYRRSSRLNLALVILFFAIAFSWYIYTSNAGSFESFLSFGNSVVGSMGDFFNFGSRSEGVLKGIGLASSPTPLNTVSRVIAYAVQAFIVLGFFSVLTKRTNTGFSSDYIAFAWVSISLLAANVLLPRFAQTLNVERFYHISLFFLAPFFVIGAEVFIGVLTDFLSKRRFISRQRLGREVHWKPAILLLAVLVSYFLFQTNFIYEVAGQTEIWSVPLRGKRLDALLLYGSFGYVDEFDVFGARWLAESIDLDHTTLFSDFTSMWNVLRSYGMFYSGDVKLLGNSTEMTAKATVYMSRANVVNGTIRGPNANELKSNTTLIFSRLVNMNKVFTNGACEIYEKDG